MLQDNFAKNQGVKLIAASAKTATANGTAIDRQAAANVGFNSFDFYFLVETEGDTLSGSVYMDLHLEDSPNNSDWTDVTNNSTNPGLLVDDVNLGAQFVSNKFIRIDIAGEADAVYHLGYAGGARYVRPVILLTGSHSSGTVMSCLCVRGLPATSPVDNS